VRSEREGSAALLHGCERLQFADAPGAARAVREGVDVGLLHGIRSGKGQAGREEQEGRGPRLQNALARLAAN
jgi:hypothetical protein